MDGGQKVTNKTPDDVRREYTREFGEKNGRIAQHITYKVVNMVHQWSVFLYFFCGPQQRVNALNDASRQMTKMLQAMMWDSTLLRIRQLTDGAQTRNNDNLSLEHLVRIASLRQQDLAMAHKRALDSCRDVRTHASKYLAHLDLNHALGGEQSPVTRRQTTDAVRAISGFVRKFHLQVRGVDHSMMPIMPADDESQFLLRLHRGNVASDAHNEAKLATALRGDWTSAPHNEIPDWVWRHRDENSFLDEE